MSFVDPERHEVNFKIVYWGPGLAGKTSNLQSIYVQIPAERRSKMISLETEIERTLFFDFEHDRRLPDGRGCRLHLYCAPGCTLYYETFDLLPRGADGVVFVVDSMRERLSSNVESLDQLEHALQSAGSDIDHIPLVFQFNKQDLDNALEPTLLARLFDRWGRPHIPAVAQRERDAMRTLRTCADAVIDAWLADESPRRRHLLRPVRAARHAAEALADPSVKRALTPDDRRGLDRVEVRDAYDIWPYGPGGVVQRETQTTHFKLVVWGARRAGRSTVMQAVHGRCRPENRSPLRRAGLDSEDDSSGAAGWQWVDFAMSQTVRPDGTAPMRFHMHGLDGPRRFRRDDDLLLRGASGVLILVDLRPDRLLAGLRSLDELWRAMVHEQADPETLPSVVLYTHGDDDMAVDAALVGRLLGLDERPAAHGAWPRDDGVFDATLILLRAVHAQALDGGARPGKGRRTADDRRATRGARARLAADRHLRAALPEQIVRAIEADAPPA